MAAIWHVRGFTLVELLVGMALMAMLLLLMLPSSSIYLADARIRAAAQAYYSGAQSARAEAMRRNAPVHIVLTDEPDTAPLQESASGRGWAVLAGGAVVRSRPAAEGQAHALSVSASAASLGFDSLGASRYSGDYAVDFSAPAQGTCLAQSGAQRCLRVVVSRGGQIRLCDPSITTEGDNRKC
ncbi:pilus assembly FimT family protein [Delftia sp. PS-11]|uniref:pilus assembly FimT family protein n=1 Tax=Delftia sp. PS-11 TaxID=2767222 RepID=UPI002454253F|nr:GspH/FimT family pseudopilin [Delftia sp. PS-11]KAJ8743379.1 GspH/FimT family pseudopilin [Delftia sp. PS-11]